MSSTVIKSDKRHPGTPDVIITQYFVLEKKKLLFHHNTMKMTLSEQSQSTRPPVFWKNGKAGSSKTEMIRGRDCSQSLCPEPCIYDKNTGRGFSKAFHASTVYTATIVTEPYTGLTVPACILVTLCGALSQLALDSCYSSKALPRAVDALPLALAWTALSSLTRSVFR